MLIRYVEIGGKVNDVFRRNIVIEEKDKQLAINKYNFSDTYSTIYSYDNKDQNIANILAPIYIDIDANELEKDFETLKRDVLLIIRRLITLFKITEENIELYFSGSKGFHIIIPHEIFGLKMSKDLNGKLKLIAMELKSYTITKSVDTRIYDTKRLFREPNTINTKTGLYKVQILLSDIRTMSYDDLMEHAKEPKVLIDVNKNYNMYSAIAFNDFIETMKEKQKQSINYKVAREMLISKELLPCVQYILQNGAQKGGRNNISMALASALFQRDLSNYENVLNTMIDWNRIKNDDPLSDREIETTTRSAYKNVKDERKYGCGSFIDLGICVKGCPIRKQ